MLGRPASEKRRGTKSREVGAPSVPRALWGFGPRHQVGRGYIKAPPVAFRAGWVWVTAGTNTTAALPDRVGGATAGRFVNLQ
jgi:hypothetical protein